MGAETTHAPLSYRNNERVVQLLPRCVFFKEKLPVFDVFQSVGQPLNLRHR